MGDKMCSIKLVTPLILAAVFGSGVAQSAESNTGLYGTLSGGWAFFDDLGGGGARIDLDDGYDFGAALGYKYSNNFRAEFEISFASTDIDSARGLGVRLPAKGDLDLWSGMINGFYDFDLGTAWVPSVGGGIGMTYGETNDVSIGGVSIGDDDGTDFAWQLGAGLRYNFTNGFSVGTDYRYFKVESNSNIELHKALITIGTSF